MDKTLWLPAAALFVSVLMALFGYWQRPTFVSKARATDMQETIEEQRVQIASLTGRVSFLENRVAVLMNEREFWQDEYRKLREGKPA